MGDNLREEALTTLRRLGVGIVTGVLDHWDLKLPDGPLLSRGVITMNSVSTPAALRRLSSLGFLLVTRKAGPGVLETAKDEAIDIIVVDDTAASLAGSLYETPQPQEPAPKPHRGRPGWGRWALLRALLTADHPLSQSEAASLSGTSQQATSKALHQLGSLVSSGPDGVSAADREAILDGWEASRRPPGGAVTWWYSLDDPWSQGKSAYGLADELEAEPLLGGDLAADVHAPWKMPTTVTVYTRALVDFTDAGFTPADPGEGTMRAVVPEDTTLWRTAARNSSGLRVLDPVATLGDLLADPSPDSAEAAERLRVAIIGGTVG